MNNKIQELALQEAERYKQSYIAYCKANPGYIMHGDSMKQDAMEKASFCQNLEELEAMKTYYEIGSRQMNAKNSVHGFKFSREAINDLIKLIKNE